MSALPDGPTVATATTSTGLEDRIAELGAHARRGWMDLPTVDVDAAVHAGALTFAAQTARANTSDGKPECAAERAAAAVGAAAAHVQRQGLPGNHPGTLDWAPFGGVIPVLGASSGVGVSVVAAVLADAVAEAGWRTLLVDTAEPARSGLAMAASDEGPLSPGPNPTVRLRFSPRGAVTVARIDTTLPVLAPGMVPPPPFWCSPHVPAPQVTVVDLAADPWRLAAHPLASSGHWLRAGSPTPRPLLVCRASRPSLQLAEQVLARWEHWVLAGVAAAPRRLVVTGARRWPPGVAGVAGRRLAPLLDSAVFLPHDPGIAVSGITAESTPQRLRRALAPVLRDWGVLSAPSARVARRPSAASPPSATTKERP